jgi:DNA-binding LytR/AlgR family response regulator
MNARAIVVEDEVTLRQQLEELLANVWPELEIVASVGDGVQALAALERHRPDLMFLDVEMPEMSGIEVARHASGKCHVAFVTAYSSYATQAFDAGAVDYVLKPISRERLAVACKRLQERLTSVPADLEQILAQLAARVAKAKPYLRWITASRGANVRMITIEEVCYFQADTKYTLVALADGESLIHIAIRDLLEQLDPQMFWQIHRATIVNVQEIETIGRDATGHVEVRMKRRAEPLRVSQQFAYRFRQM